MLISNLVRTSRILNNRYLLRSKYYIGDAKSAKVAYVW
jgi:hypothetical protein